MSGGKPTCIACANQKGGVGKTTTSVHLAVALARSGAPVRLFDLDAQRNAVLCLCSSDDPASRRTDSVWTHWLASPEVPLATPAVLPGPSLGHTLPADAEFVVLDCPPSLDGWTEHALAAADHVLIPLQCEFLAMEGLARILHRVEEVEKRLGRGPGVHILPVMMEPTKRLHQEILEDIWSHLPDRVCSTWIPRDSLFPEAASFGMSLFKYNARSVGARAYAKLAREVRGGWT